MTSQSSKPEEPDPTTTFRDAMRDVTPLRQRPRVEHGLPGVPPVPLQRLRDNRAVLVESLVLPAALEAGITTGEELVFLRPGLPRTILRNLRRGHWIVQGHLDLHGHTSEQAREAVALFLAECIHHGKRCVRIVHGKGLGSRNREPVLKGKVARWLAMRDEVLAYCEARPVDGGSGAAMVLLRGGGRKRPA
jgi:DNA-nicking Smr family endonuclease